MCGAAVDCAVRWRVRSCTRRFSILMPHAPRHADAEELSCFSEFRAYLHYTTQEEQQRQRRRSTCECPHRMTRRRRRRGTEQQQRPSSRTPHEREAGGGDRNASAARIHSPRFYGMLPTLPYQTVKCSCVACEPRSHCFRVYMCWRRQSKSRSRAHRRAKRATAAASQPPSMKVKSAPHNYRIIW